MNCDRIAWWYRSLEYAAFGKRLERCRSYYLHTVRDARKVLMLGEGDGRFLRAFAAGSRSEIDYVDLSAAMLELARVRSDRARARREGTVRFFRLDVRDDALPRPPYDLIVSHFFLDCFDDEEIQKIVSRVANSAAPRARWVVSEFRQPGKGIWKYAGACILRILYSFFRWTTGLGTRSLPSYRSALESNRFVLESERVFLSGLLVSELWRRE